MFLDKLLYKCSSTIDISYSSKKGQISEQRSWASSFGRAKAHALAHLVCDLPPDQGTGECMEMSPNLIAAQKQVLGWRLEKTKRATLCARQEWKVRDFQSEKELLRRIWDVGDAERHHPALRKCLIRRDDVTEAVVQAQVPGWRLEKTKEGTLCIRQEWKVKDAQSGNELLRRMNDIADAEGHHPDLHMEGDSMVLAELSTHSIGMHLAERSLPIAVGSSFSKRIKHTVFD